ncbi:hypothetical protein CEXT_535071 [Caerostris extrusa]|uniref:Uncharacterized protein n=1 Tax=Caerostris extrusa TaxID=172846 RepID=A0AAV4QTH6_CAEEX|nr:hypothetical protein CEXT_535071 [Caerostris extrusa]
MILFIGIKRLVNLPVYEITDDIGVEILKLILGEVFLVTFHNLMSMAGMDMGGFYKQAGENFMILRGSKKLQWLFYPLDIDSYQKRLVNLPAYERTDDIGVEIFKLILGEDYSP